MRDVILALDMGGTSIKRALVGEVGEPMQTSVCAFTGDTRETLLQTLRETVLSGREAAGQIGAHITRIGVACPGPFDFRGGVSRMTHKWAGINGVPLPPVLNEGLPGIPITFLHDSTAFMLGEAFYGAATDAQNPAGVMLGTGFGYSYMRERRVCLDETLSPLVRLWRQPYRDGITEDYVSRRAIRARYARKTACEGDAPDVREIATRADAGEPEAVATLRETGELLGDVLRTFLPADCDLVVIGGQIAYAAEHLLPAARPSLTVPVRPAAHIADAALRGIYHACTHTDATCTPQD